jgi:hypothetical protein
MLWWRLVLLPIGIKLLCFNILGVLIKRKSLISRYLIMDRRLVSYPGKKWLENSMYRRFMISLNPWPKFGEQFASKLDREIEEKKRKEFERRKQKIEYKKMLENKFISVETRREEYQKMLEEKQKTFYDNYLNKAKRSQDHIQQKNKELKWRL